MRSYKATTFKRDWDGAKVTEQRHHTSFGQYRVTSTHMPAGSSHHEVLFVPGHSLGARVTEHKFKNRAAANTFVRAHHAKLSAKLGKSLTDFNDLFKATGPRNPATVRRAGWTPKDHWNEAWRLTKRGNSTKDRGVSQMFHARAKAHRAESIRLREKIGKVQRWSAAPKEIQSVAQRHVAQERSRGAKKSLTDFNDLFKGVGTAQHIKPARGNPKGWGGTSVSSFASIPGVASHEKYRPGHRLAGKYVSSKEQGGIHAGRGEYYSTTPPPVTKRSWDKSLANFNDLSKSLKWRGNREHAHATTSHGTYHIGAGMNGFHMSYQKKGDKGISRGGVIPYGGDDHRRARMMCYSHHLQQKGAKTRKAFKPEMRTQAERTAREAHFSQQWRTPMTPKKPQAKKSFDFNDLFKARKKPYGHKAYMRRGKMVQARGTKPMSHSQRQAHEQKRRMIQDKLHLLNHQVNQAEDRMMDAYYKFESFPAFDAEHGTDAQWRRYVAAGDRHDKLTDKFNALDDEYRKYRAKLDAHDAKKSTLHDVSYGEWLRNRDKEKPMSSKSIRVTIKSLGASFNLTEELLSSVGLTYEEWGELDNVEKSAFAHRMVKKATIGEQVRDKKLRAISPKLVEHGAYRGKTSLRSIGRAVFSSAAQKSYFVDPSYDGCYDAMFK